MRKQRAQVILAQATCAGHPCMCTGHPCASNVRRSSLHVHRSSLRKQRAQVIIWNHPSRQYALSTSAHTNTHTHKHTRLSSVQRSLSVCARSARTLIKCSALFTCMCKKFDCGCPYVPHCKMSPHFENSFRMRGTSAWTHLAEQEFL